MQKQGDMKRSSLILLAASSVLLSAYTWAGTRPHYGGTLHVAMREIPATASFDPAESSNPANQPSFSRLLPLIFDTLTVLDAQGNSQPSLATDWKSESNFQRWEFHLRSDGKFSNGTTVSAGYVAASLRNVNPDWKVSSEENAVIVQCEVPTPNLPAELALPSNSIVKRDGRVVGSGPFTIAQWDGKKLVLSAREDY